MISPIEILWALIAASIWGYLIVNVAYLPGKRTIPAHILQFVLVFLMLLVAALWPIWVPVALLIGLGYWLKEKIADSDLLPH